MFKGISITKNDKDYKAELTELNESMLPEGDVTVRVTHSTINYKDALAITGAGPVVRNFPMIPGIDFVGIVEQCDNEMFEVGEQVLLNGFGVGETHCGGLASIARVKSDWLIKLPPALTGKQAMAIGTAGYTAMLSVMALERQGISPESGDILVTGANGGVGSYAIAILSKLGYRVIASTGRMEEESYLGSLGAAEIIHKDTLNAPGRPLNKEKWAAAIDSVGSHTLANVCASTKYGGVVAACGLAQGMDFPATVAPFILRGITLAGIDSVMRPISDREKAWSRLSNLVDKELIDAIANEIELDNVLETAENLLAGKIRGRVVVNIS